MPRPATPFQKKIIKRWLGQALDKFQNGDQNQANQIYNVIMFTDAEMLAAVNAYVAEFLATHNTEIDNLNAVIASLQAQIAELEAGEG